jgi:uncharacterized membrane protein YedE/YeeE
MLILNGATAYHWAIAGAGIGVLTLVLLAVAKHRLGISTGFENVCSLVVNAPYLRREAIVSSHSWRLPLLGGLVIGGALSAVLSGGWSVTWDLGVFDAVIGWGEGGKVVWMFVGGLFIGVGTRMAGGCTSGHGIFGLSNLEGSGLVSTLSFMAAGVVTTNVVYRLVMGV